MALHDELDKLKTAEEYLLTYSINSQEWEAAWEHVRWTLANTQDIAARTRAQQITDKVIRQRYSTALSKKLTGRSA